MALSGYSLRHPLPRKTKTVSVSPDLGSTDTQNRVQARLSDAELSSGKGEATASIVETSSSALANCLVTHRSNRSLPIARTCQLPTFAPHANG